MMKSLERTFPIRVAECDVNNYWRPGAILTELQEAATLHSSALGCGREELLREGLAWVVVRLALRMHRYPVSGETVTVRTFHRPHRHTFFPRYFVITDSRGEAIGEASSLWLLMDLETRQAVPASRLPSPLPDNSDLPEPLPLPGAIPALSVAETVHPWTVHFTDLDPNRHVNNTRYADWLCNVLGIDTMSTHLLEALNIHFNAEVLPGHSLILRLRREGENVQLLGDRGDKIAFEIGASLISLE
ncbi:MAG: hypothetical protein IKE24_03420 [Clostridia bacterium]|nr:hypothetical protein [Clostridia bacterium]